VETKTNKEDVKKTKKRLVLRRETLRSLDERALANVRGGVRQPADDMGDVKGDQKADQVG
jgi:hypothetical protein